MTERKDRTPRSYPTRSGTRFPAGRGHAQWTGLEVTIVYEPNVVVVVLEARP